MAERTFIKSIPLPPLQEYNLEKKVFHFKFELKEKKKYSSFKN